MPSELYENGRRLGMAVASASQKMIRIITTQSEVEKIAARRLIDILNDNPEWFTQWDKWREGFIDGFLDRAGEFKQF